MSSLINRLASEQGWGPVEERSYRNGDTRSMGSSVATGVFGDDRVLAEPTRSGQQARFRTLMVPLDGTPLGEGALPLAVSIARRSKAELRLVHVYSPMESIYFPQSRFAFEDEVSRQRRQYLEDLARQIESAASVCVIPEYLERREVIDGLCEAASGVDLIVAATHGYGMLERLWHGSQLHELMRRLATPLLVVRGNGLRAAIAPDRCIRQMLVPLDGTESAERVLDSATALGSLYGAEYSLLRVVPLGTMASSRAIGYSPGGPFSAPGMAIQAEARRYLRTAEKRMRKNSAKVDSRIVITGESIAKAIVSRAHSCGADCIAMTTRTRGGLTRLLRPSITTRVIQLASMPILIVRD